MKTPSLFLKRVPKFSIPAQRELGAGLSTSPQSSVRRSVLLAATIGVFSVVSAPAAEEKKTNIGVSIPAATHSFTAGIVYWANQAKKDLEKEHPGMKVTVKTAGSAPEQANQLQDLLTVTKIDTLVIFPFESASLTKPVAQLKNKGVYVTVVDRGLTDTSAQDAYVSGDNTAFGKVAAEYLAKALDGKGNIVVLRGIPTTLDNERMDAFNEVMKNYPEIKILDAKHGNWNRDDAFKVMQDYLTRFKEIDAVWAADDDLDGGNKSPDSSKCVLFAEVHVRRDQADCRGATQRRKTASNIHHPLSVDHQGKRERLLLPGFALLIPAWTSAEKARFLRL
jgi:ribose transport system substrate-binding protein